MEIVDNKKKNNLYYLFQHECRLNDFINHIYIYIIYIYIYIRVARYMYSYRTVTVRHLGSVHDALRQYRQFTPNPEGGSRSNATLFDNRQQKNSEFQR